MQTDWSIILHVLLLIIVIIATIRVMQARKSSLRNSLNYSLGAKEQENKHFDEIIAVRKIADKATANEVSVAELNAQDIQDIKAEGATGEATKTLMIFLLAKEDRQLVGYELLQTILAAGLRFGTGDLFHRHQYLHGQGPIMCSLAAATANGVFNLQNMGTFSAKGLCLFMELSGNETIDAERLNIMHQTAKQLADELDTHLLDDERKVFTEDSLSRYFHLLSQPCATK